MKKNIIQPFEFTRTFTVILPKKKKHDVDYLSVKVHAS